LAPRVVVRREAARERRASLTRDHEPPQATALAPGRQVNGAYVSNAVQARRACTVETPIVWTGTEAVSGPTVGGVASGVMVTDTVAVAVWPWPSLIV